MKENESVDEIYEKRHELEDIRDALCKISKFLVEMYNYPSPGMNDVKTIVPYRFTNAFEFRDFLSSTLEQFVPRTYPYEDFLSSNYDVLCEISQQMKRVDVCITIPMLQYYSSTNNAVGMSHREFLFAILAGLFYKYAIMARNVALGRDTTTFTFVGPKEKYRTKEINNIISSAGNMCGEGDPLDWGAYKPGSDIFSALAVLNASLDREIVGRMLTLLMFVSGRDRNNLAYIILNEMKYFRYCITTATGGAEAPSKLIEIEKLISTLCYSLAMVDAYDF